MSDQSGFVVLESGPVFPGRWHGGAARAGELVFNTSHSGYEEMATDPSYFSQILITTASQQGNYGIDNEVWESRKIWIQGFVCLELQSSKANRAWEQRLIDNQVPVMSEVDTRELTLLLRDSGTQWGALVQAETEAQAIEMAQKLIREQKKGDIDWAYRVSVTKAEEINGDSDAGPKVAIIDYGCKTNTIRELKARCSKIKIFPSRASAKEILDFKPDGVLLSNGPGNPEDIQGTLETVRELLGKKPIFGICMGHHILGLALGAKTYKLKFGHRGSNHPIKDEILGQTYMTSQNHGYAVVESSLPKDVKVTHRNLNDGTVAGIECDAKKAFSVQFHPESHPGPHDSVGLFDYFAKRLL